MPKAKVDIRIFDSMAGSGEKYCGTENIRIRKINNGCIRIHVPKSAVSFRERNNYVALDIDSAEVTSTLRKIGIIK